MFEMDSIPPGLDTMEPGPVLAGWLAAIDVTRLSGYDRVLVLRAHGRMAAHYQAQAYRDMAAVTAAVSEGGDGVPVDAAAEGAAAEIRAALRLTRRAADMEIELALDLERRVPGVRDMLERGDIDLRRARVLVEGTRHLPTATARRVTQLASQDASDLTTGQLRARLRRMCIEADPDAAAAQQRMTESGRRLWAEPNPEGTVNIYGLDLPADRATAAVRRINHIARSLRTAGEHRTMDQLRADVFIDVLLGTAGHEDQWATIDLRVDLDTLACLSDTPGDLEGFGPVVADVAGQVAAASHGSSWRFRVVDPSDGAVVRTGVTRRRPLASDRRDVEAATPTCAFPGCRVPSSDCDLDHTTPWARGGTTDPSNLAPLCRHDHRIRHRWGWRYRKGAGATHQWTSPLGHSYTTLARGP